MYGILAASFFAIWPAFPILLWPPVIWLADRLRAVLGRNVLSGLHVLAKMVKWTGEMSLYSGNCPGGKCSIHPCLTITCVFGLFVYFA